MANTILSIIIPVYNVEQYIDQCIQSILIQEFQDYEVILVDDGSTDSSGYICDIYAEQDERIKVIHKKNGGVSFARNRALQIISSKYVTFIDPDDFIESDTYTKNMSILLNDSEIDILQYPLCRYYSSEHIENSHTIHRYLKGQEEIFSHWWSGSPLHYSTCNKIFKIEIFNNITFLEGHVSEDTRLVASFYKAANTVYLSDKGRYYYRTRPYSLTSDYSYDKHLDLFYAHLCIYTELIKFPSLVSQRAVAFERMLRRMIQAQQSNDTAHLTTEYQYLNKLFPSWREIFYSKGNNKLWLSTAKAIGIKNFTRLFIYYLKFKSQNK